MSFKEKNTPSVGTVVLLKDNRRNQACRQIGRILRNNKKAWQWLCCSHTLLWGLNIQIVICFLFIVVIFYVIWVWPGMPIYWTSGGGQKGPMK